jgi:hypothetical protein
MVRNNKIESKIKKKSIYYFWRKVWPSNFGTRLLELKI